MCDDIAIANTDQIEELIDSLRGTEWERYDKLLQQEQTRCRTWTTTVYNWTILALLLHLSLFLSTRTTDTQVGNSLWKDK